MPVVGPEVGPASAAVRAQPRTVVGADRGQRQGAHHGVAHGLLDVDLLVVLGHEGCGAVAAAARVVDEVAVPHGYIRDVTEKIAPNVLQARLGGAATLDEVGRQHAQYTLELVRERSAVLDNAIRRGALAGVAAQYSLSTGRVTQVPAPAVESLLVA